jgi:hypothetical protein
VTIKTYYVTNVMAFGALELPLPPNSLLFRSYGEAGGVLMLPGLQYAVVNGGKSFKIGPGIFSEGDRISAVTFG